MIRALEQAYDEGYTPHELYGVSRNAKWHTNNARIALQTISPAEYDLYFVPARKAPARREPIEPSAPTDLSA